MKRSTFLKSAGICLALPHLESLSASEKITKDPKRFVAITTPLAMYDKTFFPEKSGADYQLSEVMKPMDIHRKEMSIFQNLDHGLTGGHRAVHAFLSGVNYRDLKGAAPGVYPEANITLDQKYANEVGHLTRIPSMSLCSSVGNSNVPNANSWTKNGTRIPIQCDPVAIFDKLFVQEDEQTIKKQVRASHVRHSILDAVMGQAKVVETKLGNRDRQKLDAYFTAIRDLERKLKTKASWLEKAKPEVDYQVAQAEDQLKVDEQMFELMYLAILTDSTRSITFQFPFGFETTALGLTLGYHGLSHHGKNEAALEQLAILENYHMKRVSGFVSKLKESDLLKDTYVLFGSGMGDGATHRNTNLPVMLCGGDFKHGEHRVFSADEHKKVPLNNLYVSILQCLGIKLDKFHTSTGNFSQFVKA